MPFVVMMLAMHGYIYHTDTLGVYVPIGSAWCMNASMVSRFATAASMYHENKHYAARKGLILPVYITDKRHSELSSRWDVDKVI